MKRFFDLSILLLLPVFFFSTLNEATVTTEPVFSSEVHEIFEILNEEGTLTMRLEEIQEALEHKEIFAEAMMLPCNPPNDCYTEEYLNKLLAYFGECDLEGRIACLDFNGDGCITAADLTFLLGHYCN